MNESKKTNQTAIFSIQGEHKDKITVAASQILNALMQGADINISNAIIKGHLNIGDIALKLEEDETEQQVIIDQEIRIQYSEIYGDVNFGHTEIKKDLSFTYCEFKGAVGFDSTTFRKNVFFDSAMFEKHSNFTLSKFEQDVCFDSSIFKEECRFNHASFRSKTTFRSASFLGLVDFSGVLASKPIDFNSLNFRKNTTAHCIFNILFRIPLRLIVKFLTLGRVDIGKTVITEFNGFNTETVIDGGTNAYLKRYVADEQWIKSWKDQSWFNKIAYFFWELSSHCGRSFVLWLFWVLIIVAVFGAIYDNYPSPKWMPESITKVMISIDPKFKISDVDRVSTKFSPYYFSMVALSTLGFGDIYPANKWGEIWITVQVLIGYIMLGGLISIFANKFARRS